MKSICSLSVLAVLVGLLPAPLRAATPPPVPPSAGEMMTEMNDLDEEEKRLKKAAEGVGAGEGRAIPGEMTRPSNVGFQGIELLGVRMTGYPVGTVLPASHPLKNQMDGLNEKLAGPQREKFDAERKASDLDVKVRDLTSETGNLENRIKGLEKQLLDLSKASERETEPKKKTDILREWRDVQDQLAVERPKLDKAAQALAQVESQKASEVARVKGAEAQLAPLRGQMQAVSEQIAAEETKRINTWLQSPPINP